MKATDLMVGDYIQVQPSGMLIKVAAVHKKKIGYHTCNNRLDWVRGEWCLKPIPLTLKILEKNGFEYKEGEQGMYGVTIAPYYTRKDVSSELFCDGDPFAIWFKDEVVIKYVHQLQHALRLCGIEKTIEI